MPLHNLSIHAMKTNERALVANIVHLTATAVSVAALAMLSVATTAANAGAQRSGASSTGAPGAGSYVTAQLPAPQPISNAEYAQRRDAFSAKLPNGVILVIGGREASESYVPFSQSPDFRYLTGVKEPSASLVGVKTAGKVQWTIFVQPKDPAREVWDGQLVGTEAALKTWGIAGRASLQLEGFLDSLFATTDTLSLIVDGGSRATRSSGEQFIDAITQRHAKLVVKNASSEVAKLRAFKSSAELALIKRSTEITVEAHAAAARTLRANSNEYETDAVISYTFRKNGAERASFPNIVGSGPNSTTLHYRDNNRVMLAGEMVVVDIGALYEGYSADMTRSYPVTGTYTPEQRAIYQLVRDAQAAAERQAKVGGRAANMSDSASATLAAGLAKLGLIDSAKATYDCSSDGRRKCSQLSLYYMHGLGHGIGLQVHDPDRYYFEGVLGEGSVFTIEPGIYVRENLLEILPSTDNNKKLIERIRAAHSKYNRIGVRIEDDFLVTKEGLVWLTKSPREINEIEALMKGVRQ